MALVGKIMTKGKPSRMLLGYPVRVVYRSNGKNAHRDFDNEFDYEVVSENGKKYVVVAGEGILGEWVSEMRYIPKIRERKELW